MARDYKHRANSVKKKPVRKKSKVNSRTKVNPKKEGVPLGRWVLALLMLVGFAYFLYSLSGTEPGQKVQDRQQEKNHVIKKVLKKPVAVSVRKKKSVKKVVNQEVQYDFYTLLPEAEFTIPDHEVKSIKRAERVGKAVKNREYSVQVSSFRTEKDADSLKAKLLLLGFIPKIEKASVKGRTWYRVKIGPYQQMKSVDAIVSRLKENNIDVMVTAVNK
jgi:cell division protein FtsN